MICCCWASFWNTHEFESHGKNGVTKCGLHNTGRTYWLWACRGCWKLGLPWSWRTHVRNALRNDKCKAGKQGQTKMGNERCKWWWYYSRHFRHIRVWSGAGSGFILLKMILDLLLDLLNRQPCWHTFDRSKQTVTFCGTLNTKINTQPWKFKCWISWSWPIRQGCRMVWKEAFHRVFIIWCYVMEL